jgi:catecholate siderophore receptor
VSVTAPPTYQAPSISSALKANVENLFDVRYFINADSNTNISPGSPRAVRVALVLR